MLIIEVFLESFTPGGIAGLLPRVESSLKNSHFFEADISQSSCRTGTRSFLRSRAIGNNQLVARQLVGMKLDLVRGDSQGARQFLIGLSPGFFVSRIDQYSFLTTLDPIYKINRSNSRWLHFFVLPVSSFRARHETNETENEYEQREQCQLKIERQLGCFAEAVMPNYISPDPAHELGRFRSRMIGLLS